MLVGAFGASAFGLRGGIPMEAAQTSSYRVPTLRDRIDYLYNTHSPRNVGHRCLLQRFESALDVQRLVNRGQLCESRGDNAPLDTRAIPKAPHSAFAAIS